MLESVIIGYRVWFLTFSLLAKIWKSVCLPGLSLFSPLHFWSGLLQDDRSILEKQDLSLHSRVVIQLRLAEKQILEKSSASGRTKRLHFQKKLEEGAPLPRYEESDIALLENTDAKIPIILRKLEEMEEGQDIQVEESSPLLVGEKAVYGMDMEANGQTVQEDAHKTSGKTEVSKGDNSASDLVVGST